MLLTVFFIILLVLFGFGYVSAYLPPRFFWWTGILASLLPYTTVLTLTAGVLMLLLRGRRWAWAVMTVLLLTVIRFLPLGRIIMEDVEPQEDDLVVMTFNAPVRGPNPDTLAQVTLDLVEQIGPDILAVQEPAIWIEERGRRRATAHLQALIDSLDYWAPTPRGQGSRHTIRQPVVARFPLGTANRYTFASDLGLDQPTYVTRVPFTWQGRDAVLYNLHLHTTGQEKPWQLGPELFDLKGWRRYLRQYRDTYLRRAEEARRLRALIDRERVPVVVAGDFNSTVHGWEVRHVRGELADAFRTEGRGWGATYHARFPIFRIDHILVSDEWKVVDAYVPDTPTLSDHRPLVARLRWKEPTGEEP